VLARTVALGVCATVGRSWRGLWCRAARQERLILGHESLGAVEDALAGSGFARGDLVVGIVRRPDPVPCQACAAGEWDMCRNGRYTERGIKERNGYGAELFRIEPEFAVKIDPALGILGVLMEPASIVAQSLGPDRAYRAALGAWRPTSALVTGCGPIGLLAALMGIQRGLEVHVLDHRTDAASAIWCKISAAPIMPATSSWRSSCSPIS